MFKFWQPKFYEENMKLVQQLRAWHDDIELPFPDLPFFSMTTNTGPKVVTPMHADLKNKLEQWCIIQIFGNFNHRRHGLLVLQEPKLMLQLKRGDIVFIPSALITHGNTEVPDSETRRSWTFFNAGGLFRFRDAGFRTAKGMERAGEMHLLKNFTALYPDLLRRYMENQVDLDYLKNYHKFKCS